MRPTRRREADTANVARPARLAALAVWGVLWSACAGPQGPRAPVVPIEPALSLELLADDPAPAGAIFVRVLIEPTDGRAFTIAPVVHADGGRPPALLELTVSWQDYGALRPEALGRRRTLRLEWDGSGRGEPGRPARLAARLDLSDTAGVLARRILVEGRLIGVDLSREGERSGGMVLELPATRLSAYAAVPPGSLASHLQSGSPDGIFLAAVSAAPERQDEVLETLVESLPSVGGAARNAVFAALYYMTGETHGTDIHRWSTWWGERRHERP
jgi:hypothetical protein